MNRDRFGFGQDHIKFEPKTAEEAVRKKVIPSRKLGAINYSQNKPREKRMVQIKKLIKERQEQREKDKLLILGHTAQYPPINFQIRGSEKLKAPIIQSYHRNAQKGSLGVQEKR